jgi:phthalate 4,5-dioxygenase
MHVPVDDTHTYWYAFFTSFAEPVDKAAMRAQRVQFIEPPAYLPKAGRHNQWGFNPKEQREQTFLGMGEEDINVHDQWAVESMGPSRTAPASTWAPPTRSSWPTAACCCRPSRRAGRRPPPRHGRPGAGTPRCRAPTRWTASPRPVTWAEWWQQQVDGPSAKARPGRPGQRSQPVAQHGHSPPDPGATAV